MESKKNNRFSLLIMTALFVGGAMMAYYYYTNKVKTKRINDQAYHLLYRKASDIRELELAYQRIIETKIKQWIYVKETIKKSNTSISKNYIIENMKHYGIDGKTFQVSTNANDSLINFLKLNDDFASFEYTSDTIKLKNLMNGNVVVTYNVYKNDFLRGLNLGKTFFDEFALTNKNNSIYLMTSPELANLSFSQLDIGQYEPKQDSTGKWQNLVNFRESQIEVNLKGSSYQAFMVPVNDENSQGISYIIGFIKTSTYKNMCRGLDYRLSLSIFFTVFFILLSIPLIRLLVVSPGEPYGTRNMIVLTINISILALLLAFGLLRQGTRVYINQQLMHYDQTKLNDQGDLKQVSEKIKAEFNEELDSMVLLVQNLRNTTPTNYFDSIDNLYPNGSLLHDNAVLQKTSFISRSKFSPYPYLYMEIKSDENARVDLINSTVQGARAGLYIDYRDYYQHPQKFKLGEKPKFGFESIFDMSSGIPEAAVSMPREDKGISAITSHMYSVSNTILPEGFSFCVIDKSGKVWFHKNKFNNSRENFLEEITQREILEEALLSRTEKSMIVNYKLAPQYLHIQPIRPEMDLFMVTMCSKKMYDKKGAYLSTVIFTSSILFLVLYFTICLISIFVFRLFLNPFPTGSSTGNRKNLLLSYFPTPTKSDTYINLSFTNLFVFIVLLLLYTTIGYSRFALTDIFIYMLLTALSIAYWNLYLQLKNVNNRFRAFLRILLVPLVPFSLSQLPFLNTLFGHVTWKEQFSYLLFSLLLNLFFLLVISLFKKFTSTTAAHPPGIHTSRQKILVGVRFWLHKHWHFVFASRFFTVILYTVFLPIFVFFMYFYQNESAVFWNRQMNQVLQTHTEREDQFREDYLFEGFKNASPKESYEKRKEYFERRMKKGIYLPVRYRYSIDDTGHIPVDPHHQQLKYIHQFGTLRTTYHNLRDKIEYGVSKTPGNFASSSDTLFRYSGFLSSDSNMYMVNKLFETYGNEAKYLRISMHRFDIPIHNKIVLLGIPLILLVSAFIFIRFMPELMKHLFPSLKFNNAFVSQYRRMNKLSGHRPKNIYYMTMPSEALIKKRFIEEYDHPIQMIDATELLQKSTFHTGYQRKNIFISFYYFIRPSMEELQQFISNFKFLLSKDTVESVNIVALFSPLALIQHLNQLKPKSNQDWKDLVEEFSNLIYGLHAFYIPINKQLNTEMGPKNAFIYENKDLIKSIISDVEPGTSKKEFSHEEYVTYSVAYPYYQRLWNSCTPIEKSVLYDIADDHVINLSNKKEIGLLMNKGLIVSGAYLQLFESSFERFVLKQKEEIKEINDELREIYQGGWSAIRLPVLIISASILLFLVITQQNILTDIQSVLISVGTIVTLGLRFVDLPILKSKSNK